jgi:hypothetical protein
VVDKTMKLKNLILALFFGILIVVFITLIADLPASFSSYKDLLYFIPVIMVGMIAELMME